MSAAHAGDSVAGLCPLPHQEEVCSPTGPFKCAACNTTTQVNVLLINVISDLTLGLLIQSHSVQTIITHRSGDIKVTKDNKKDEISPSDVTMFDKKRIFFMFLYNLSNLYATLGK